jgi:hypothetical protein
MRRICYGSLAALLVMALAAAAALATPTPNGASLELRTFNNCALSTLTSSNNYPFQIWIQDVMDPDCVGGANLHSWSFSEDGGTSAAVFNNNSNFEFSCQFILEGTGQGEGGLRISPWWSKFVDGRFALRTSDGEIACWGGRLPFYSFTGAHGLTYTKGDAITLCMKYLANGLVEADPATIQYQLLYNSVLYSSPVLAFDMGNPGEDPPYGLWGMLNDGRVGSFFLIPLPQDAYVKATWNNICYYNLDGSTPAQHTTWGQLKNLYR